MTSLTTAPPETGGGPCADNAGTAVTSRRAVADEVQSAIWSLFLDGQRQSDPPKRYPVMSHPAPEQNPTEPRWKRIWQWVRRHRVELLLFILLWTTYSYFYQATGDNEACRLDQLRALVADHTLKIDKYWWNTADVIHYPPQGGAVYPNKAPGTTLLLAPAYAVAVALLSPLRGFGVPEWVYWHVLIYLLTIFTISFFCALAGVLMYRILAQLTGNQSSFGNGGDCHLAWNPAFPFCDFIL